MASYSARDLPIDIRPNGELCLDNMKISPHTNGAFIDSLIHIWSVDQDVLNKYLKLLGIKSLKHSSKIVDAMKRFKHWEQTHILLDTGEILDNSIEYLYGDQSLHFYSNKSEILVKTCVISYYRYINVGKYDEGMKPQPNVDVEGDLPHSYINRLKNHMFLSSKVNSELMPYFALDNEASYSISDATRAGEMTELLTYFIPLNSTVIDMTACVGGNTIAFSESFIVRAQEIDSLRYTLLRYNCRVAGVPDRRYVAWCVDSLSLFKKPGMYSSGCVYCDPPWGGPEYIHLKAMDLTLGDMDLIDIALNSLKETKVFMCRTTFNYNRKKFSSIMNTNGYEVYTYVTYGGKDRTRPLFYLLFVVKQGFRLNNSRLPNKTKLFTRIA